MTDLLSNKMTMSDLSNKGVKRYPKIFTPLLIKNIVIPNRIYFAPFGIDDANDDGTVSDSLENFYVDIAKGGCGLTMLSNCSVSPDSMLNPKGLRMYEANHWHSMRNIIRKVENYGGILGIQLQHYGAQGITTYSKKDLLSPSGNACASYQKIDPNYRVREMTLEDIEIVKSQFINSAIMCASAGIKYIQLQASNGYLLHSFMSPYTNKRQDQYGGNYENRARLLVEIIAGIKAQLNDDVILSARIGVDDYLGEEGLRPDDFSIIMPFLERSGIDLLMVTITIAETFKFLMNRSLNSIQHLHNTVKKIKSYTTLPIGFSGFTSSLDTAEELLETNITNLVGMARSLFADNDLILKSIDDKADQIFQCLWDGNCFKDKSNPQLNKVHCCVNPKYKRPDFIKYT